MKRKIIEGMMNLIKKNYDYSDEKLLEIKYGLDGLYLTLTKTIIIIIISVLAKTINELLLIMLFYSVLRTFAFGLHAKKSWHCWISSLLIFGVSPYVSRFIIFPFYIKIILLTLGIILMFLFAPADTEKHPLINSKKRKILKFISTTICICYSLIAILIKNELISTIIILSIFIEIFMIIPISYKIFKLKYDNYKSYQKA